MNTGENAPKSQSGLLTTIAATLSKEKINYALEGSVFVGGAVIQWLRDELGLIKKASDSEKAALKVDDNGGVYIVPAFAGLGAPYWDMYARGTITGLTRGSNKNHIIRSALESIAYQTNDLIKCMKADSGIDIASLKADGGAANNKFLMQFQADISDVKIIRPDCSEATALGAAFLAGLAVGFCKSKAEILNISAKQTDFTPAVDDKTRENILKGWQSAIEKTLLKE